jgi:sugar phosphate permease
MINRVGRLGDQMNPKTFLLLGMALTGAVFLLLGLLFKVEENHRIIILLLMVANGIC